MSTYLALDYILFDKLNLKKIFWLLFQLSEISSIFSRIWFFDSDLFSINHVILLYPKRLWDIFEYYQVHLVSQTLDISNSPWIYHVIPSVILFLPVPRDRPGDHMVYHHVVQVMVKYLMMAKKCKDGLKPLWDAEINRACII